MGLSLKQKLSIIIPKKANRTIINGKTYATDINGKGLYCLANNKEDENEGYIIDETFKVKKNASNEIKEKIIGNKNV
jgi:hypothetical protein